MHPWRSLLAATLSLCLLALTVATGVAQGHAPAVGTLTLCTGQGVVVRGVDAQGNLVETMHVCPDGLAAGLAPSLDTPLPTLWASVSRWVPQPPGTAQRSAWRPHAPLCRGPPRTA